MITQTTPAAAPPVPARAVRRRRPDGVYYLFLLPALVLFTFFVTLPAVVGFVASLTNSVGFGEFRFIGLVNYRSLVTDPRILGSYAFTFGFALVTVVVTNVVALALALGLHARIPGRTALRAVFVVPMVVSGIVIAYVFNYLFSTSAPAVGAALGASWLQESILAAPETAWIGVVIVTAWQAVPSALIIYLAGLLAVPEDVYEAAALDGAGAWRRLRSITLPLIAGYVLISSVLGLKNFFNAYDIIVGLTGGGPGTSTTSIAMTIFNGFGSGDYGYQMANAVVFFVVLLAVSIAQLRLVRSRGVSL
jgi:raffinose/stachyose/melibiose transport system permease protein